MTTDQIQQQEVESATRREHIQDIIERYEMLAEKESETAVDLRQQFLHALREEPDLLQDMEVSDFLATAVEPDDFADQTWESPQHMMDFGESLYRFRYTNKDMAGKFTKHARFLLRRALYTYEQAGELEKMFQLLRLAPSALIHDDEELSRMLYRANAYELRRVSHRRRFLYGYLALNVILVLFVFPYLFINAENGRLQREVEQLTDVEIGDEGYQLVTYSEGVYWAVITAGSIGYGDITPRTTTGRFIAGTLGTMGVITEGIIAGLALDWITPRRIT
jgi:hypothetical protein